ncbi:MAG: hypothetical protein KatS3mg065_0464 [Chloroflexota bacterium]|nr:MAG: hypothetical protein KatS3mg065_0464 [Chloroflexota bacterium]
MTRRGLVLFAAMSVIWGIPYLLIRIAVGEISPATLVLARTAIAAAILLPIAVARVDFGALRPHWPWIVAFALVEIAGPVGPPRLRRAADLEFPRRDPRRRRAARRERPSPS